MKKQTFKCVRFDETMYWNLAQHLSPPDDLRVYGIYLFCPGEATYLASLTPSSWCQFLFNEAVTDDDRFRELFDEQYGRDGEDHYFAFLRGEGPNISISSVEIEYDEDDPDASPWDEAIEHFLGNAPQFP